MLWLCRVLLPPTCHLRERCTVQGRAFNGVASNMNHLDVLNRKTPKRYAAFQLLRRPKIGFWEKLFSKPKCIAVWLLSCRRDPRWKFTYKYGEFKFGNVVSCLGVCVHHIKQGSENICHHAHAWVPNHDDKRNRNSCTCTWILKGWWIEKGAVRGEGLQLRRPNGKIVKNIDICFQVLKWPIQAQRAEKHLNSISKFMITNYLLCCLTRVSSNNVQALFHHDNLLLDSIWRFHDKKA